MEFLAAAYNLPFTVALALMLGIALLEGVAMLLGAGLSDLIDQLLPTGLAIDANLEGAGVLTRLLGWLQFGRVPALMLLVIFLTAFGCIGLGVQTLAGRLAAPLPATLAALPALLLALPLTRASGSLLALVMPRDESQAVSATSFIGRVAVITLGSASHGHPAEARLKDQFGQSHYVMVEPDDHEGRFAQGEQVLLVSQEGACFRAIPAEGEVRSPHL